MDSNEEDDMYGWRAKIGFMVPSSCTVYEPEFAKIISGLEGVIGCASRLLIETTDVDGMRGMNQQIDKAAKELATIDPDVVAYMCTSGSFYEGRQGEQAIRESIKSITDCRVISTSQAVVEALNRFNAKRVVMLAPYNKDITLREVNFLESAGIDVVDYHYRDIEDNLDRGAQPPEVTFHYAKKLNYEAADALFLSCGNIRTLEIIPTLEQHTGKPVVASSPATTWLALREAGVLEKVEGFGRLLTLPRD
jgi:maleate cis-trans isomerase